jgi:glutaredoxin-like YruB-family protein
MNVKVYSTPTCPWCKKVKNFLTGNKVEFTDIDVGNDESASKEMVKISGQIGVPVIDVNGTIISGFDEAKLKKILKI